MTINETMLELLKMIGPIELLDEDEWPWRLMWNIDYWRWVPEPGREVSPMCRYPREAQVSIEKAAIEWLDKKVEYLAIEHDTGQLWEVQWMMTGNDHNKVAMGPTLLEALHAAVKAIKAGPACLPPAGRQA